MINQNPAENNMVPVYISMIAKWHRDRNLIDGSNDLAQFAKLASEMGELADNIAKGRDIKDDIGDMIVVLINIAERNGLSIVQCLEQAWKDIKDRKGRMVNGVFVKESDLPPNKSDVVRQVAKDSDLDLIDI